MSRIGSAVVGVVVLSAVALATWWLLNRQRSEAELAEHVRRGAAYAARELDVLGTLPVELRESSGVAVSRMQPGVLWSHNDSGDGPTLYAIDTTGRLLAVVPVANARARDWEDIAAGPCPEGGPEADATRPAGAASCLYIGDTGDNERIRDELTVYVVAEPSLGPAGGRAPAVTARSFRYRYPDEAHDSEALAVRPDGDVTIVSKGRTGTIDFFGFPPDIVARAMRSGELLTAERRGDTGIVPDGRIERLVTGAAVSPDGRTLAVRTYDEVFFYGATKGAGWRDLDRPCFLGDAEPQGEGIDYLDAETLVLTSEFGADRPGTIHRLRC